MEVFAPRRRGDHHRERPGGVHVHEVSPARANDREVVDVGKLRQ